MTGHRYGRYVVIRPAMAVSTDFGKSKDWTWRSVLAELNTPLMEAFSSKCSQQQDYSGN